MFIGISLWRDLDAVRPRVSVIVAVRDEHAVVVAAKRQVDAARVAVDDRAGVADRDLCVATFLLDDLLR